MFAAFLVVGFIFGFRQSPNTRVQEQVQKDFPELVVSVAGARFTHGHLERVSLVTSEISLRAAAERLQTYVMCASELNKAISGKNKFRAQI